MKNSAILAAVDQLKQEHIRLCNELARVDEALTVLSKMDEDGTEPPAKKTRAKRGSKTVIAKAKRKVSPAARKKMSEAARARWAARKGVKPAEK